MTFPRPATGPWPRSAYAAAVILAASLIVNGSFGILKARAAETLEQVVGRANTAAGREDFPAAIRFYEQALRMAPAEKTLRRNLAVLYANHATRLQEAKQYDAALSSLDKAQALTAPASREFRTIQDARAGVFYAQAMEIRNSTADPQPADEEKMKTLLEKAIDLNPDEVAFKKGLAGVYSDEAYRLAMRERFAEARPLLEKALTYDAGNVAIRKSLANVYLGLARDEQDPTRRKADTDKALSLDPSPATQSMVERLLASRSSGSSAGIAQSDSPTGGKPAKISPALARMSISDMLRDMEGQLQVTPPEKANVQERLAALEKQIYGKPQSGPVAVRAKAAYTALMGGSDGAVAQSVPNVRQAPVEPSENSYLDEIFRVTDGRVIRWGRFPLRVYIEEPKDNTLYKSDYKQAALQGLASWKTATNDFVRFVEIKNPDAADIQITWTEQYTDRFSDPEHVPAVYRNYSPPKRTRLMQVVQVASMLTPGYFSLAPQAVGAAMQYQQNKKLEVLREESRIKLGLEPTRNLDPEPARLLIRNMAAKEFGHALGLKANSPTAGDLLYPELRSDMAQNPTQRDLNTLNALYNRPPNILLNVR